MKTFLPHLIILTTLTGLTGCGSKAVGKLEVSQSFATTNTSFGGGLVISGKHLSSGRTFSHSILSGKEMRINLESGVWKISAVGWDGGGAAGSEKLFAGNTFCGTVQADLVSASTVVDLNITQINCNSAEFSAGHVDGAGNLKNFDAVITCNSFFNPAINLNASIASQIVPDSSSSDYFCESVSLANDLKSKVQAVSISAMEKLPGQVLPTAGFSTGCMSGLAANESIVYPTNVSNPYNGYTVKLPFSNLPLIVTTYKDTTCAQPVAVYHFENGLQAGSPDFDHLLQSRTTSAMKLLLPGSDLRKVYSPLIGLMPSFKNYDNGSGIKLFRTEPSGLNSYDFHGKTGLNSINLTDVNTCSTITVFSNMTAPLCILAPDGKGVKVSFNGSSPGTASFTLNTINYSVYLTANAFEDNRFESQKLAMDLIGHAGDNSVDNFFGVGDQDEKNYGVLSQARNMFSGNGAGGVLGIADKNQTFENACLALNTSKEIKVYNYEKLMLETYRVDIHNSVVGAPTKFHCVTANMDPSSCSTGITYDKRMLIYDYKQSAVAPMMVMEFSCSELVGSLEIQSTEIESSVKKVYQQIVNWNTETTSNLSLQRFEQMTRSKRFLNVSGAWVLENENRSMSRVRKFDALTNYEIWHYHFNSNKNASNLFDQRLGLNRIKSQNIGTTLHFLSVSENGSGLVSSSLMLSDGAYSTIQNRALLTETMAKSFDPYTLFPQSMTTSAFAINPESSDFANSTLINDVAPFLPGTLGTASFNNSFGGSFFTSP